MKVSDLKPADYNPRLMTDVARESLAKSIEEFGDLSGIVFNATTGSLICGHQRRGVLSRFEPTDIEWGEPYSTALGDERDGWFDLESGVRFRVREVNWTGEKERLANVAANNPHIQGVFDIDALGPLLEPFLDDDLYAALSFDALAKDFKTANVKRVEFDSITGPLDTEHSCPKCGFEW